MGRYTKGVDVLAVMRRTSDVAQAVRSRGSCTGDERAEEDAARAAVAELIEAADLAMRAMEAIRVTRSAPDGVRDLASKHEDALRNALARIEGKATGESA